MEQPEMNNQADDDELPHGLRVVRVILLESVLVAIIGGLVWGIAWDFGFPRAGLGLAIAIWVIVSPVIEIATVLTYRKAAAERREGIKRNT